MRIQQRQQFGTCMPRRIIGKIILNFFSAKFKLFFRRNFCTSYSITTIVPYVNWIYNLKRINWRLTIEAIGTYNCAHPFSSIRCKGWLRVANSVRRYSPISSSDGAMHNTISDLPPNMLGSTINLCRIHLAHRSHSLLSISTNIRDECSTVLTRLGFVAEHRPSIASSLHRIRCLWPVSRIFDPWQFDTLSPFLFVHFACVQPLRHSFAL